MRIVGVEVGGFGRLRGLTLGFDPGFNLIYGRNEAGKSTLLEAMQALLFGFADSAGNGATQKHNALVARYRPWDGGHFDGALRVVLANGDEYRIQRDFERGIGRVYREPGASDVTANYPHPRRDGLGFADVHLGLTRAVFRASAWIDQGDIHLRTDDVSAIKDMLERLADSAGTEASAQEALKRLGDQLRERVNPQGHLARRSPLLQAREDVERLERDLEASRRTYGALEAATLEERRLETDLARQSDRLLKLEAQLAWRELTEVEDKLSRLGEVERQVDPTRERLADLNDVVGLTNDALQAATSALDDVDRLGLVAARAVAVVDDEADASRRDEREAEGLATELDEILDFSEEAIVRAEDAARAWDEAARVVAKARDQVAEREARLIASEQTADPSIQRVPPDSTLAGIQSALAAVDDAGRRLRDLDEDAATATVPADQEAEFDVLDRNFQTLTADRLENLQDRERLHELAAARGTSPLSPVVVALFLVLVGLAAGYLVYPPFGAAVGALVGGLVGIVLARITAPPSTAGIDQDRAFLKSELTIYGVTSVAELRRSWNRRQELLVAVGKGRELRQKVALRREEMVRAFDDLERLSGTRDVTRADALAQALRERGSAGQRAREQWDDARHALADALDRLTEIRDAALAVLPNAGVSADDPATALARLTAVRFNQRRRLLVLRQQSEVEGRRRTYAEHERARDAAREELAMARTTAAEWLAAVGVTARDASARTELNLRRDRFEAYQFASGELRRGLATRAALVGADDPSEWNRRRASLRARVADADRADARPLQDLRDDQQETTRRRDEAHRVLTELRAETSARFVGIRSPALIVEELAGAGARLERLTRLKNALEGATALLTAVADEHRRDFAPRLRESIRVPLATITANRYEDVAVDPTDLSVRLKLVGRSELVELDQVSHGTRDAIGLLLRCAFVDLLGRPGEPVPLFLDDPLVHVDPDRTQRILDVLIQIAKNRQIFFVTQDPQMEDWVVARGACVVQRLDRPS